MSGVQRAWDDVAAKLGLKRRGESAFEKVPGPSPAYPETPPSPVVPVRSPNGEMDGAAYQAYLDAPDPLRFVSNTQKPGVVRRQLVRELSNVELKPGTQFPSDYQTRQMLSDHGKSIRDSLRQGVSTAVIADRLKLEEFQVVWIAVVDPERPLLHSVRGGAPAGTDVEVGETNTHPTPRAKEFPDARNRRNWIVHYEGMRAQDARVLLRYHLANGDWNRMTGDGALLSRDVLILARHLLHMSTSQVSVREMADAMTQNRGKRHKRQLMAGYEAGFSLSELAQRTGLDELDVAWVLLNLDNPAARFPKNTLVRLRQLWGI